MRILKEYLNCITGLNGYTITLMHRKMDTIRKRFLNTILFAFLAIPVGRTIPTAIPTSVPTSPARQIERIIIASPIPTAVPQRKIITVASATPTQAQGLRVLPSEQKPTITITPTNIPQRLMQIIESNTRQNSFLIDGKADESTRSSIPVTIASYSALLTKNKDGVNFSFDIDDKKIDLPIRSDFRVKENEFFLLNNGNELALKYSPRSFYVATQNVLEKIKGELQHMELTTQNNKAVYLLRVKIKRKLLGIFPYEDIQSVMLDAFTNKIDKIDTSLLSKFAGSIDWAAAYAIGPNVVIKDVKVTPFSYHPGETLTVEGRIYNEGTDYVTGYWDANKPIRIILQYGEKTVDQNVGAYVLAPGQWNGFVLKFADLGCSAPLTIWFDPDNYVKETSKKDNTFVIYPKCAPTSGPDLVVTSITYPDNYGYKVVGKKNKVNYTIKNIGDQNSIPVQALARQGIANMASLFTVAVTKPGFTFTGSFDYTPTSCDPLQIEVDGQKYMQDIETNRDNNIGYDTVATNQCNSFADLTFGQIYWKVDGYSFGKSHYPNGSTMQFEIHVKNRNKGSCTKAIYLGVYDDAVLLGKPMFGSISCPGDSTVNVYEGNNVNVDDRYVSLSYVPKCDSTLLIQIDPDGNTMETNKGNNVWVTKIECE
jgi:hypothetical protein